MLLKLVKREAEHRQWQTPGVDAQILHASVRSPRETLVVCLVKWCRLACGHYTLFPIMSISCSTRAAVHTAWRWASKRDWTCTFGCGREGSERILLSS